MNKKLSGSEFRKRAAKKESDRQELLKKVPKIATFFTSVTPSAASSKDTDTLPVQINNDEGNPDIVIYNSDNSNVDSQIVSISESKFDELLPLTFNINDPATWDISLPSTIESVVNNPPKQNFQADFSKSERIYNDGSKRTLTLKLFKCTLSNSESYTRDWLIYSKSSGKVFCVPCCLFQPVDKKTGFSAGFNDWKHGNVLIKQHEQSVDHRSNMLAYINRQKQKGQINTLLSTQYEQEVTYWRNVLQRIVSVVKFLSVRGLPFQGDNEHLGSTSNGLFLGCLELISEFDPFLSQHLVQYGNKGSGHVSYLSAKTCDEFISIMADCVLQTMVEEVKHSRYFALIVDSTPDCSHTDQLAFVLRYVCKDAKPKERLFKVLPGIGHTSSSLEDAVVSTVTKLGLNIELCRGQSYDNAANMSGAYAGLQARIKQHCPFAEFVPCAAHSLNLVGSSAAECCSDAVMFFGFLNNLFTFFSCSTHRWSILKASLENSNTPLVKSLSQTRWSARADAVKALVKGYKEIKKSLKQISEDPTQKPAVQVEALGLENKFGNFEIAFLTILWNDILERFDKVSKSLQSETLNLAVGKTQLQTLESYLNDRRDEFDKYEQNVMTFLQVESPSYKRIRTRKTFADETIGNEAHLDGRTMFKTQVYIRIIDSLISNLSRRKLAYEHLADKFEILSTLVQKESQNEAISQAANKLYASYPNDIGSEFENECLHFKMYVEQEEFSGIHDVYEYIITNELKSTFPNLEVAVRIFLTLPVTNCSAERGFSALNRLKNVKRSALSDNKLNCLMLLCCEKDLTLSTDFSDVVNKFAKLKARKKSVI